MADAQESGSVLTGPKTTLDKKLGSGGFQDSLPQRLRRALLLLRIDGFLHLELARRRVDQHGHLGLQRGWRRRVGLLLGPMRLLGCFLV